VDLRQLRRFVAVARSLNYRRAAAQLGITQPPLTRSIRELERSLGATLLSRSRNQVSLTPAGQLLLAEAPRLIAQAKRLAAGVARAAAGVTRLHVGYVGPALYRIIPSMLPAFRARWPGLELSLEELPSSEQLVRLQDGRLDLGFVVLGDTAFEGLQHRVIERSRLMLAVPADSPLAGRRSVRLAEVAAQPFILQSPEANPPAYRQMLRLCAEAGFAPRAAQRANQAFTILKYVASGLGVGFVPEMAADLGIEGVALLPIADRSLGAQTFLGVVWARSDPPREMADFIRLAEAAGSPQRPARRPKGSARA
jgi:DNA-binding transcriptional LysR family regulator